MNFETGKIYFENIITNAKNESLPMGLVESDLETRVICNENKTVNAFADWEPVPAFENIMLPNNLTEKEIEAQT